MTEELRTEVAALDDLTITLDPGTTVAQLASLVRDGAPGSVNLVPWVAAEAVEA
jgi:hypothetical protein